jgi:hypothetical protein
MVGLSSAALICLIHRGQIEVQLTRMFGLELGGLQLHHHMALEPRVIEKQINEELVAFSPPAGTAARQRQSRCPAPAESA